MGGDELLRIHVRTSEEDARDVLFGDHRSVDDPPRRLGRREGPDPARTGEVFRAAQGGCGQRLDHRRGHRVVPTPDDDDHYFLRRGAFLARPRVCVTSSLPPDRHRL